MNSVVNGRGEDRRCLISLKTLLYGFVPGRIRQQIKKKNPRITNICSEIYHSA